MKLPDEKIPDRALILDPYLVRRTYEIRTAHDNPPYDEVWDGTLVLYPLPDNLHQEIRTLLCFALLEHFNQTGFGKAMLGVNISDRTLDWMGNYRCPDVVAYLAGNPAKNCDTHYVGGPDLAVEIISPGEDSHSKLEFYTKVNTREVLIVNREPWVVELFQLQAGKMVLAGQSDAANQAVLTSAVLPLSFQLRPGTKRPAILVTHNTNGQTWTA